MGLSKALSLKFSFPLNPSEYHNSSLRQRLFLAKVPFGLSELEEISMKTKCINVIADSAGVIFHHLGEVFSEVRYRFLLFDHHTSDILDSFLTLHFGFFLVIHLLILVFVFPFFMENLNSADTNTPQHKRMSITKQGLKNIKKPFRLILFPRSLSEARQHLSEG